MTEVAFFHTLSLSQRANVESVSSLTSITVKNISFVDKK